jgi:hypothetical protein
MMMNDTKNKGFTFENFVIFKYIYIGFNYTKDCLIITQGEILSTIPVFNSLKFWKQLGWINIKSAKQVGIKFLN